MVRSRGGDNLQDPFMIIRQMQKVKIRPVKIKGTKQLIRLEIIENWVGWGKC